MSYVALSRVRNLDDLLIDGQGFDEDRLTKCTFPLWYKKFEGENNKQSENTIKEYESFKNTLENKDINLDNIDDKQESKKKYISPDKIDNNTSKVKIDFSDHEVQVNAINKPQIMPRRNKIENKPSKANKDVVDHDIQVNSIYKPKIIPRKNNSLNNDKSVGSNEDYFLKLLNRNIPNACFCNSIIQALLSLDDTFIDKV